MKATAAGTGSSSSGSRAVNPPTPTVGWPPPFTTRLKPLVGRIFDDLQIDHRRLFAGATPRKHLWNDVLLDHRRIARSGGNAIPAPDDTPQDLPRQHATSVEASSNEDLQEMPEIESAGLQDTWHRHSDCSTNPQLRTNQGVSLPTEVGAGAQRTTASRPHSTIIAAFASASDCRARLCTVQEECADFNRQAYEWRNN